MAQLIKNIKTVQYIESRLLANISLIHLYGSMGVLLNYWRNWQTLPTVGLSEMTVASTVTEKSRIFTTTLKCTLAEHFDVADRHLCYLVTAVDGSRYLIGSDEKPYPVTTTEDVMPGRETEKSCCNITVEYKNTLGLLVVMD